MFGSFLPTLGRQATKFTQVESRHCYEINWDAWFFTHLELNYYRQCQPTDADLPGQCSPDAAGGEPSFSFLSGYQGSQTDPNDLFVMLELPGDAIPYM